VFISLIFLFTVDTNKLSQSKIFPAIYNIEINVRRRNLFEKYQNNRNKREPTKRSSYVRFSVGSIVFFFRWSCFFVRKPVSLLN